MTAVSDFFRRERSEWIAVLYWMLLGVAALAAAAPLHNFMRFGPGPGLLPRLTAATILILAGVRALQLTRNHSIPADSDSEAQDAAASSSGPIRFALLAGSLFIYAFILEPLGFFLATCALSWLTLVLFGRRPLRALLESIAAMLMLRYAFVGLLGVQLPYSDIAFLNGIGF